MADDGRLAPLGQGLNYPCDRLGLDGVVPDLRGRASADRLRTFAEGRGQSAGECSTPRQVALVMARFLIPQPSLSVDAPCRGSRGLLITYHVRLVDTQGAPQNGRRTRPARLAPLTVFDQGINPSTFAISRMHVVSHDLEAEIALGGTKHQPACTSVAAALAPGRRKQGAGGLTRRYPVECPDADQKRDVLFRVANAMEALQALAARCVAEHAQEDLAAVTLIDRCAQAEGVARKDVVNRAVHERFERRHDRPGETPCAMAPWAEEPA
jgi:hypothetical protein